MAKKPYDMQIDLDTLYEVTFDTTKGTIVAELDPQLAPKTVNEFVSKTRDGFYDGLTFHRVVPVFVIQGGDPDGTGRGGPGYKFEDEPVKAEYTLGALAMANAGPNTNGSQFFICIDDCTAKLEKLYNLFGYVTSGMDHALAIEMGDVMRTVTVSDKPRGDDASVDLTIVSTDDHNIVSLLEDIGARVPERECIVWGERRLTWADQQDRSRRLAHVLLDAGVGGDVDATPVRGWESPHQHVALYLTNGNEYLEAMLGAWKARAAAVNVNYRYTAPELAFLLRDCRAAAVVYHRRFAPTLADALRELEQTPVLIAVDDGSGEAPIPGSLDYETALGGASPERPDLGWSADDRYVVYTGGTTGKPKGVLWRQGDFLASALGVRGGRDELLAKAERAGRPRALPAPPFMHGAAHWNALSCLLAGGTVVIQRETERLDAADVLDTCAAEAVGSLLIVGDAFARPLADEIERRPRNLSYLRFLMTGGAVLSPALKERILALLPDLSIVDILGSSETGRHGLSTTTNAEQTAPGTFSPSDTTVVLDAARRVPLRAGSDERGWLAQRGRVPLGYLGDRAKTEATFPRIEGVVHAVAGDRALLDADGRIVLLGRDSATINTGGEKVHAEEVEQALKEDGSVYDALVVGRPSQRWGSEIVAVVSVTESFDPDSVLAAAADTLARYKLPKSFVVVDAIRRSASGKPDYAWAREVAAQDAD